MKIAYFLGSLSLSGGVYVVLQHAIYALEAGHDLTLVYQGEGGSGKEAWHPALERLERVRLDHLPEDRCFDLVIATFWTTALELDRIHGRQYAYFVQSIESRFFPEKDARRSLVEGTYRLPVHYITEASWIQGYLQRHHRQTAHLVRNGIRKDLYTPHGSRIASPLTGGGLRVLIEGPVEVAFKNVPRTIKVVRQASPAQIWLLTSSRLRWFPGLQAVFSRLPITEVPAVYRSCDVLVKLSLVEGMFGPPLEMFHCGGTAIVYDVSGHEEYVSHGRNAVVVPAQDEEAVVQALRDMQARPDFLHHLKEGARETARTWPDWTESSAAMLSVLERIVDEPAVERSMLRELNAASLRAVPGDGHRLISIPARPTRPPTRLSRLAARVRAWIDFGRFVHQSYW